MPPLGNPSVISHSASSARSDLKEFTSPMAAYKFRMRAICDVSDIRTFLRLMLMAFKMTGHLNYEMTGHCKWVQFSKLRRQSFCESHFDELFKRRFAFVDPRA